MSENVKKYRELSKLSAKALGKKLGVSEGFILEVEQGRRVLNEDMIKRFSKLMGKNINEMGMESFEAAVIKEERNLKAVNRNREKPVEIKTSPAPKNDLWNQAFGDNLKNVPIYTKEMRTPIGHSLYPIVDSKIEKHPFDRVLIIKIEDDSMKGYGFPEGTQLLGVPCKEAIEEGFYLIETDEKKIRLVRNMGNGNLIIKRNEDVEYQETRQAKEVKVFVRFFQAKRNI